MKRSLVRLRKRLLRELDAPTVLLTLGIVLLSGGAWMAWHPAGLLVPGAVITWIVLPSRVAFIVRPVDDVEPRPVPRGKV